MIQESKFLGGDMEHTHLVKGLDFALLQKVSTETTVLLLFCPARSHGQRVVAATYRGFHLVSVDFSF